MPLKTAFTPEAIELLHGQQLCEMMIPPGDDQIGNRIREARLQAAMTQSQLAIEIGCSSQQIHKYESGHNRVSAGTLFAIACILDRPIEWFFNPAGADPNHLGRTLH